MKLHYYPETDSLYVELQPRSAVDSQELVDGLVVDFDEAGHIVGIDIDHASETVDLSTIEAVALPLAAR